MTRFRQNGMKLAAVFLLCVGQGATSHAVQGSIKAPAPWLRLEGTPSFPRLNAPAGFMAYTDANGRKLRVVNLNSGAQYLVTNHFVGSGFVWEPQVGHRLFYREVRRTSSGVRSILAAFDTLLKKSVVLDEYPEMVGELSYDPYERTLQVFGTSGIHSKQVVLPDVRLGKWQQIERTNPGKWIATTQGLCWSTLGGITLRCHDTDKSGVRSFDVSPDGRSVVWSTRKQHVYASHEGAEPIAVGDGQDPRWHPRQKLIVYSGIIRTGRQIAGYDLCLADLNGKTTFLTRTPASDEQGPVWHPDGRQLYFSRQRSTDVFRMELTL